MHYFKTLSTVRFNFEIREKGFKKINKMLIGSLSVISCLCSYLCSFSIFWLSRTTLKIRNGQRTILEPHTIISTYYIWHNDVEFAIRFARSPKILYAASYLPIIELTHAFCTIFFLLKLFFKPLQTFYYKPFFIYNILIHSIIN